MGVKARYVRPSYWRGPAGRVTRKHAGYAVGKGLRSLASLPVRGLGLLIEKIGDGIDWVGKEVISGPPLQRYADTAVQERLAISAEADELAERIHAYERKLRRGGLTREEKRDLAYLRTSLRVIEREGTELEQLLRKEGVRRTRAGYVVASILFFIISALFLGASTPSVTGYTILQSGFIYSYFPFFGAVSLIMAFVLLLNS